MVFSGPPRYAAHAFALGVCIGGCCGTCMGSWRAPSRKTIQFLCVLHACYGSLQTDDNENNHKDPSDNSGGAGANVGLWSKTNKMGWCLFLRCCKTHACYLHCRHCFCGSSTTTAMRKTTAAVVRYGHVSACAQCMYVFPPYYGMCCWGCSCMFFVVNTAGGPSKGSR